MKSLTKIFIYLLLSVVIGAAVAPIAYGMIVLFPSDGLGFIGKFIYSVQQMPFHRYASRSIQVIALLMLWPMIKSLKIKRMSDLALYHNKQAWRDLWGGIVMALIPLWLLEIFFVWQGWYVLDGSFSFGLCGKILGAAIVVAIVEECLFRGVLLGLSRRFLRNEAAIFFTTLIFTGVHFLNLPHHHESNVCWWSGFSLLFSIGSHGGSFSLALGACVTLVVLGMILAWVTIRTESLWLAIGLHGAWIFGQQIFNAMAHYRVTPSGALLPWLGPSQIYGMVPVGIIIFFPFTITTLLLKKWLNVRATRLTKEYF